MILESWRVWIVKSQPPGVFYHGIVDSISAEPPKRVIAYEERLGFGFELLPYSKPSSENYGALARL